MAKIWEHYRGYNLVHAYSNLITRSCFSSFKMEGLENIPRKGAVLLAPNHCATLMDPMAALVTRREPIAFGARSDIFAKPGIARILRWLRIVPIARERNGLSEVAKNLDTFDEIVDCLAHDTPFCLYAEGTHRPEHGMLPVKKGIFRIAKLAHERLGQPVYIVPIGTNYEDFFRGQRRIRLRAGIPMEIGQEFAKRDGKVEAEVFRELCEELRARDLELIGEPMTRRHGNRLLRAIGCLLSLPLFVLSAALSLPIWLPYVLIMRGMKDKAWSHTVRYVLHLFLPLFVPFHIPFEWLLNQYRDLLEDFRA